MASIMLGIDRLNLVDGDVCAAAAALGSRRSLEPEQLLQLAVVEQATKDLLTHCHHCHRDVVPTEELRCPVCEPAGICEKCPSSRRSKCSRQAMERRETWRWFNSEDNGWPYDFAALCTQWGWSQQAVVAALSQLTAKKLSERWLYSERAADTDPHSRERVHYRKGWKHRRRVAGGCTQVRALRQRLHAVGSGRRTRIGSVA